LFVRIKKVGSIANLPPFTLFTLIYRLLASLSKTIQLCNINLHRKQSPSWPMSSSLLRKDKRFVLKRLRLMS